MIAFAYYILKVFICSSVLFLYYKIALQDKAFHQWNRLYLLTITILSLILPCLEFQIMEHREEVPLGPVKIMQVVSSADEYVAEISVTNKQTGLSAEQWGTLFYVVVCILFSVVFVCAISKILKLIRNNVAQVNGKVKLIETNTPGTPFSFFQYIFWNPCIDLHSESGRQILLHEMVHVQQRHSLDKLFMQIVLIFFWCNPVFWLIRRELSMIHEFIADHKSVGSSGATALAAMILQATYPGDFPKLVNPFFTSSIKRRLAMLTKDPTPRFRYITRIMALPVLVIVGLAFTLKTKDMKANPVFLKEPITVIIDAGHGYRENNRPDGATVDGVSEDDLVLEIAKRIKDVNSNKQIRVILTREDKNIIDLHERVKIAAKHQADLFISLHVAALASSNLSTAKRWSEGIEVFVSRNNPATQQRSELLGSALINQLKPIYNTFPGLLKRETIGLYVLDKNASPAVMINCGYMTNKNDLEFIKKQTNQQSIAEAILNAIEHYATQMNSEKVNQQGPNTTSVGFDTVPRKKSIGRNMYVDTKQKIILEADTIINITEPSKTKINARKALFLINGQRTEPEILLKKTIISKELIFYTEGDPEAIRLYGDDAKRGVIVFNGATIIDTPNRVYYKSIFDRAASSNGDPDNKIFIKAEVMPQFPGGDESWQRYTQKQLNTSVPVANGAPNGTYAVEAKFIVDESGTLSSFEPLTKNGYGMEEELIRLIGKGPKWIPAVQNGRKVKCVAQRTVKFVVPVESIP